MTKEERAAYNRQWYLNNKDKCQEKKREAYHKNKNMYIEKKKNSNKIYYLKKKGITLQSQEPKIITKRFMNINEILDILRKDMKHELWNKSVRRWTDEDWYKFSLL
jgi:hypothetical protein